MKRVSLIAPSDSHSRHDGHLFTIYTIGLDRSTITTSPLEPFA